MLIITLPECKCTLALSAGERVGAGVRCPVLPELEGTVCGKRAVWATLVAHPCHGSQLLRAQLLLVHHRHVRLHLALVGKPVSTQPAGELEVPGVNKTLVVAHVVQSGKLLSTVRTLCSIGKVMCPLVFGQAATARIAVATLVTQKGLRLQ